jgi:hypothetical protein
MDISILVVGGAAALRGYHAWTHRVYRTALLPEELAIKGGLNAAQDIAAQAPFGLTGWL